MEYLLSGFTASFTSYLLIFAAEIGDKSQLVCMVLAARHRAMPVMLGAVAAFALLNVLAVIFGVAIASWLPQSWLSLAVALLFALFGLQALAAKEADEDEAVEEKSSHSLFMTTLLLIALAEFGDKTQIAVVALGTSFTPLAVWLGATLALATTSALGVWAGRTLLQRMNLTLLHRASGILFMLLAAYAAYNAYLAFGSVA